jgi:hypothetical protein
MWQALRAQPWFSRAWVIQEVSACTNVWVICNRRLFRWQDLADANNAYVNETMRSDRMDIYNGRITVHNVDQLRKPREPGKYLLIELLSAFRNLQASDPRDKVYAFLGMAADVDKSPRPDYSQSTEQIYHSFARYFVSQGQGMELICEAGRSRSRSRSPLKFPSWVVDWSYNADTQAFHYSKGSSWTHLAPQARNFAAEVLLTDNPSIISASGTIIDSIDGTTPGICKSKYEIPSHASIERLFFKLDLAARKLLERMSERASKYGAGIWDAYARTIIGNNSRFKNPLARYEKARMKFCQFQQEEDERGVASDTVLEPEDEEYYKCRDPYLQERRFGVTRKGYMGLFPLLTEAGDNVCIFRGCNIPFVVRKDGTTYSLIGDAYVHGLMQDEGTDTRGDTG